MEVWGKGKVCIQNKEAPAERWFKGQMIQNILYGQLTQGRRLNVNNTVEK